MPRTPCRRLWTQAACIYVMNRGHDCEAEPLAKGASMMPTVETSVDSIPGAVGRGLAAGGVLRLGDGR